TRPAGGGQEDQGRQRGLTMLIELQPAKPAPSTQAGIARPPQVIDARLPSVIDSPRKPLIVGAIVAIVAMVSFTAWASLMSVASGAIAPGKITVEGNRKAIQHRDGGPVAQVLVREGQYVEQGQPLIELDLSETRAEFDVLQSSRLLTRARL